MPGSKPGERRGGRQVGTPNKKTAAQRQVRDRAVAAALDGGWTPLDVMTAKMRRQSLPDGTQVDESMFQAAIAAAPYIHARLASSDVRVESDNTHHVVSDKPMTVEDWQAEFSAGHANDAVDGDLVAEPEEKKTGAA